MIALFGGSFDPIHEGHLHLAKVLQKRYAFEKLLFTPAAKNPLKTTETTASGPDRLELIKAALKENRDKHFEAFDFEVNRPAPSYTVETVEELKRRGHEEITFIVGNEVFVELSKWKEPKRLLELANLIVVRRDERVSVDVPRVISSVGITNFQEASHERFLHSNCTRWIDVQSVQALPYSATSLRTEISEMWKRDHIATTPQGIQRSVWLLIKEKHLYAVT